MMPEDDRRITNPKRSVEENSVNENAIPKKTCNVQFLIDIKSQTGSEY